VSCEDDERNPNCLRANETAPCVQGLKECGRVRARPEPRPDQTRPDKTNVEGSEGE